MAAELSKVHLPRSTVKHNKVLFEITNPDLQEIFTLMTAARAAVPQEQQLYLFPCCHMVSLSVPQQSCLSSPVISHCQYLKH